MPIYELECNECKKRFEVMLSFKDYEDFRNKKQNCVCTECGAIGSHKRIYSGSVNLNFIGKWYKTTKEY